MRKNVSTTWHGLKLLAAVLVATAAIHSAAAGSKTSVLKNKLSTVEQDLKEIRYKIRVTKARQKNVLYQLETTEQKLEEAQTGLARNKVRLLEAQSDLNETNRRLEQTKRQLARRRELFQRRVVGIYEGENLTYLNVVLGASDMWTFLTRAYYLQRMLDSDTKLITDIKSDVAAIERYKVRQARRLREIGSLQTRLVSERNRISGLADSRRAHLRQIEHSRELYEEAYEEMLAESRRIEEQIRRIQATPGAKRYAGVYRGGLGLPCSGRISSPFGYRIHPITGVYKLHTGVDIAAPSGTSIRSSGDGAVILAGWYGAYGYAVVVDHGGGISTLYGHCSSLLVRVGQNVKKGQVIARVGSTGLSTGPHCHFEKRINGKPVNPL